jgi:hypothetical protein
MKDQKACLLKEISQSRKKQAACKEFLNDPSLSHVTFFI